MSTSDPTKTRIPSPLLFDSAQQPCKWAAMRFSSSPFAIGYRLRVVRHRDVLVPQVPRPPAISSTVFFPSLAV